MAALVVRAYSFVPYRYPTDLMAQREAHVFKFADRPAMAFQCQIEITIKV